MRPGIARNCLVANYMFPDIPWMNRALPAHLRHSRARVDNISDVDIRDSAMRLRCTLVTLAAASSLYTGTTIVSIGHPTRIFRCPAE